MRPPAPTLGATLAEVPPGVLAGVRQRATWRLVCLVDRRLVVLCGLLALLYIPGLTWGLPSEMPVAINSEAPYDSLEFVALYRDPNVAEKYPAVQPLLALPVYGAVVVANKLTGNLSTVSVTWPYGFSDPYRVFSELILARNTMSLVMGIGVLITFTKVHLPSLANVNRYLLVALLATSGVFTYFARVPNEDVPCFFWWSLSFVFLTRYIFGQGNWRKNLILSAVCSALAIGSKDHAAGLVLGSGTLVLVAGRKSGGRLPLQIKDAVFFSAVMLGTYLVVAILPQPFRWVQHVKRWALDAPNITDYVMFPNTPGGQLGLLGETYHSVVDILSVGVLGCAVLGLAVLVRNRRRTELLVLLVPILSYYLLIIAQIRFVRERFMLPTAYLLVILAGLGIWKGVTLLRSRHTALGLLRATGSAALIGSQFVTGYLPVTQAQVIDPKAQLSAEAPSLISSGSEVLWVGVPSLRTFPNSDFYRRYQVMLPEGDVPPPRYKHIFHAYDPDYQWVISDAPLSDPRDLQLVRAFGVPAEVADRAAANVSLSYYVYRR